METSEGVEKVLLQEAEAEVRQLLHSLQPLKEGGLKGLEQQIMASVFRLGRRWMEQMRSRLWDRGQSASRAHGGVWACPASGGISTTAGDDATGQDHL